MAATREQEPSASAEIASPACYGKLSPGPGMPADEVEAHQRARLQAAMVELAGSEGYEAVTVRRLSQIAGVSTRTFYEHFQGKDECLLSTCDLIVECAASRLMALQSESDWRERLRRVLAELARGVAGQALAARLVFIEAPAAGLEEIRPIEEICESALGDCFSDSGMPPILLRGITSGVFGVVRSRLLEGQEQELPDLVDELSAWALSLGDIGAEELTELEHGSTPANQFLGLDQPSIKEWSCGGANEDGRQLLLAAAARLATGRDLRQLTTADIRTAAGVSRRSFNAHFQSAGDCFRAALEVRVVEAFEHAIQQAPGDSWIEDVRCTIGSLCSQLADDPLFTSLASGGLFADGPDGLRSQNEMMMSAARRFYSSTPPLERRGYVAAEASVGAVWGLLLRCAPQGPREVPRIVSWSAYLMLAPAIGSSAALRAPGSQSQDQAPSRRELSRL